jgi:DNA-binding NarL/FixJ family response regulator
MSRPVNDHNTDGLIQKVLQSFTTSESREWRNLDKETNRMWRNFWIKALRNRGYSNRVIAEEFEIGESTVRMILKKQ